MTVMLGPPMLGPLQGNLFAAAVRDRARAMATAPSGAVPPDALTGLSQNLSERLAGTARPATEPWLYLGREQIAAIGWLVARATVMPTTLQEGRRRLREIGRGNWPARNRELTIALPFGFAVTYEVEELARGMARHLMVSVDIAGAEPAAEIVLRLARQFGFRAQRLSDCDQRWFQPLGNGRRAVNLVEMIELEHGFIADPDTAGDEDVSGEDEEWQQHLQC